MKISKKIALLIAISFISMSVFAIISEISLNRVRINGELYKSISKSDDLVADVLPPPEYIIESYMLANEISLNDDNASLTKDINRLKVLEHE
ncbi:MAG: methyl-accepting chemotaxis protein, partial [Bacillota bacterium]|nr:methyl-accepting chemotaxis protein [Bacillota bacterium]